MNDLITRQEERIYYIYRHLRNDTGLPFYVGRGKKPSKIYPSTEYDRAFSKFDRTPHWHNIVNKHEYTVEIMLEDLTEDEVNQKEIEFIQMYGRRENGGILINLTDGGTGRKSFVTPDSVKQKLKDHNTITPEEHLRDNVFPEPNTGCWLWAGMVHVARNQALISLGGRTEAAHRFFYQYIRKEKLPTKSVLKRVCNNNCCVNPDHCYIVKAQPNPAFIPRSISDETLERAVKLQIDGLKPREIARTLNLKYPKCRNIFYGKRWKQMLTKLNG